MVQLKALGRRQRASDHSDLEFCLRANGLHRRLSPLQVQAAFSLELAGLEVDDVDKPLSGPKTDDGLASVQEEEPELAAVWIGHATSDGIVGNIPEASGLCDEKMISEILQSGFENYVERPDTRQYIHIVAPQDGTPSPGPGCASPGLDIDDGMISAIVRGGIEKYLDRPDTRTYIHAVTAEHGTPSPGPGRSTPGLDLDEAMIGQIIRGGIEKYLDRPDTRTYIHAVTAEHGTSSPRVDCSSPGMDHDDDMISEIVRGGIEKYLDRPDSKTYIHAVASAQGTPSPGPSSSSPGSRCLDIDEAVIYEIVRRGVEQYIDRSDTREYVHTVWAVDSASAAQPDVSRGDCEGAHFSEAQAPITEEERADYLDHAPEREPSESEEELEEV